MPDIFKAMANSPCTATDRGAPGHRFQKSLYEGEQGAKYWKWRRILRPRGPAHNVELVLDVMVKSGMLAKKITERGSLTPTNLRDHVQRKASIDDDTFTKRPPSRVYGGNAAEAAEWKLDCFFMNSGATKKFLGNARTKCVICRIGIRKT
jgi:hypothetical protein